ncbi:unnamed protein product [Phytophthora fragariaefolia]|uniref:Unnamed protein product n=1 Tax=Phytophthora fragariaefolia TaxID=1490495 RepID=A0A9W6YMV0_9STRA|nr:unnamed protein product [Phytophthora fragariaefolia]
MADRFVLCDDGLLNGLGESSRWGRERMNETVLRLVVPTAMVQEVLQNCHDSLEGGHQGIVIAFHRVKADYYWIGLYADVEKHVRSCPDCSSSKSCPEQRGYSSGGVLVERPLQIAEKRRYLGQMRANEASEDSPGDVEDMNEQVCESPRSLFEPGDRVWLYMERVEPGITNKLAHRWDGPFRIKKKVGKFAYELDLPARSGYRFYPVVHVSRQKVVGEFGDRPKVRLVRELTDEARLDFDEDLLPEDSGGADMLAGAYEVESIFGDRRPMETSTRRSVREFLVKWVAMPTWEPMTNLSCGGLLYDYLREKRSSQRFQMVQVADEDYGTHTK